jgi:hypothetical protein
MIPRRSRAGRLFTGLLVAVGALFALGGTATASTLRADWSAIPAEHNQLGTNLTYTLTVTPDGAIAPGNTFSIYYDDIPSTTLVGAPTTTGMTCTDAPGVSAVDCVVDNLTAAPKSVTVTFDTGATSPNDYTLDADAFNSSPSDAWAPAALDTGSALFADTVYLENGGPSSLSLDRTSSYHYGDALAKDGTRAYTYRLTNLGTGAARNVVLAYGASNAWDGVVHVAVTSDGAACADTSPMLAGACSIAVLAPGASVNFTMVLTGVGYGFADGFLYRASKDDFGQDRNVSTDAFVQVSDGTFATFSHVETAGPDRLGRGESGTYTERWTNTGTATYPASVVTVYPYDGTAVTAASFGGVACARAEGTSSSSRHPSFTCNVPAVPAGTSIDTSVTLVATDVTADGYDSNFEDWADPVAVAAQHAYLDGRVTPERSLSAADSLSWDIVLAASTPSSTTLGGTTTFTLTLGNVGQRWTYAAGIDGRLPGGVTFVGSTGGCVVQLDNTFACDTPHGLGPGESATFTLTVRASATGPVGIQFDGWAYGDGDELSEANNRADAFTVVLPVPPVIGGGPSPLVALGVAVKQTIAQAVKSGVPVTLTPNADGSVLIQLYLSPGTAKGLHLKAKPVLVGSSKTAVKAGKKVTIRTKFTKKAKAKIAASTKAVSVSEVITFTNRAGKKSVKRRTVVLKRK